MTWRRRKKFFYGLVFVNIVLLCLIFIFLIFRPAPTCFDKKQNQEETGIDCGGSCISCDVFKLASLKIYPAKYLIYDDKSMDLIAEVENPNSNYGVNDFDYKFVINGRNGEIREATGNSFILQSSRKYIISANKEAPDFQISSVVLQINFSPENWQKIISDEKSEREVQVDLLNYEFIGNPDDAEQGSGDKIKSIRAEIVNSGNAEYFNIALKFIVLDDSENIIGTAISEIEKLEPMERQTVNLTLPPISKTPASVIFEAESNIFQ